MTTISANAGWGTPSNSLLMPKGCSRLGRQFKNVTIERVRQMLPALLADTKDERIYLKLEYQGSAPGTVDLEVVGFDRWWCLDTGDEAEYFPLYMIEMERRVRNSRRVGAQFLTIHKDGWFAFETLKRQPEHFIVDGVASDWIPYAEGFNVPQPHKHN